MKPTVRVWASLHSLRQLGGNVQTMIPTAVYARESIDDSQSKTRIYIPAQLEEIRRYAKQNNYEIISEYTDPAMRGWDNSPPCPGQYPTGYEE